MTHRMFFTTLLVGETTGDMKIAAFCLQGAQYLESIYERVEGKGGPKQSVLEALVMKLKGRLKLLVIKNEIWETEGLIKDQRYRLKKYLKCLSGKDLVSWMMDQLHAKSRDEAVQLALELRQVGLVAVTDNRPFEDGKRLFIFEELHESWDLDQEVEESADEYDTDIDRSSLDPNSDTIIHPLPAEPSMATTAKIDLSLRASSPVFSTTVTQPESDRRASSPDSFMTESSSGDQSEAISTHSPLGSATT